MRAVIYTRSKDVTGEDTQLERSQAAAAERGWEVVAAFSDHGASARNLNRPGLGAAMNLVRGHGCDVLIADASERLTRSASDLQSILADADAAGVTVHAGQFTSADAAGWTLRMSL